MKARVDFWEGGRMALSSLRQNRMRTVLSTVGVGIGVATLLAILGIIQGLNASFAQQLASMGSSSVYVSRFPWVMAGNWWEYKNRKQLTRKDVEAILEQSTFASAVAPLLNRVADVSFERGQVSNVGITGTTAGYAEVSGWEVADGRFLSEVDDESLRSVAVIGADVQEGLFGPVSAIGSTVRIEDKPFEVVGVLRRKGQILGQNQDLTVIIPYHSFQSYFGRRRGISIGVAVEKSEHLNAAEDQLVGILRRARGTPPELPDDFSINRPEQLAATYQQITRALYGVAVGVGFITLLVGGIGIMNIMLVSVRERTREIGIRRALGARKRTIVAQFLMEAASVSAVGGAMGTFFGLGAALLVSEITPLAARVEPMTVVFGVSFAAFVGLLFGIWPAARAANLDPVEALRHE